MRKVRQPRISALTMASCAALACGAILGGAHATQSIYEMPTYSGTTDGNVTGPSAALQHIPQDLPRLASRDMTERYYQAYRLIGSAVLNLDGERIGRIDNLILNDRGEIRQVLVTLGDMPDADGGAIAISPHRAEIVSTDGSKVTVIRVDLSREELVQAQLTRLKSNARAPAQRGAGLSEIHRTYGPLY